MKLTTSKLLEQNLKKMVKITSIEQVLQVNSTNTYKISPLSQNQNDRVSLSLYGGENQMGWRGIYKG